MKNLIQSQTDSVATLFISTPSTCSRYESCNANICVLDIDWESRTHLQGERSCHYLRLVAKDQAQETQSDDYADPAYIAAAKIWEAKEELPAPLLTQLLQASTTAKKTFPPKVTIIDSAKAARAMRQLKRAFKEVDLPISRFN